jgi:hypothetical protein
VIEELKWDSKFFNKKIGELKVVPEQLSGVETVVEEAKKNGFKYIICKIQQQQTALIKLLESLGFYLSDIGVTWAVETDKFLYKNMNKNPGIKKSLNIATEKDIPMLKKMVKSLFLESRF